MAKITKIEHKLPQFQERKRVAAYARVSSDTELQMHSLSSQVSYYSELIQANPEWIYAGVYADEGITGTSTIHRDEFNHLMADCDAGKIDMVLVKSVSRFARDTVDTLKTTRHLKELGIDVYFEKEKVHSMSGEGELMLTLLASFAQAEAESISENEKWSVKKRFEQGEISTSNECFGYVWDPKEKKLVINEEEAAWVRYIYVEYLSGRTLKSIAKEMKEKGVCGKRGKPLGRTTISRILTSEIYVGDILLQKTFNVAIHKPKRNRGEMEQYLISNAHEPIVSREDQEKARMRIRERAEEHQSRLGEPSFFAGLVRCGKCGYACMRVVHKNDKHEYINVECNRRKEEGCGLLPIRESELRKMVTDMAGSREKLKGITIFDDNIVFALKDGRTVSCIREYPKDTYNATPFSRKIVCGHCGASVVQMKPHGKKIWICTNRKHDRDTCTSRYLTYDELFKAGAWAVGTEDNLYMSIYMAIEKTVMFNDRIEFYMKGGGVKIWRRQ